MKDKILAVARETIETLGYIPVEVRIMSAKNTRTLKAVIHKREGNVSTDDCSTVSNVLSHRLDLAVPGFSDSYGMTVESPGADRKLASIEESLIFSDRDIRFVLRNFESYDLKENVFVGRALRIENGKITVRAENREIEFLVDDVASAKLNFDIKKYLK
jgi:ribosome maturation factor RimP